MPKLNKASRAAILAFEAAVIERGLTVDSVKADGGASLRALAAVWWPKRPESVLRIVSELAVLLPEAKARSFDKAFRLRLLSGLVDCLLGDAPPQRQHDPILIGMCRDLQAEIGEKARALALAITYWSACVAQNSTGGDTDGSGSSGSALGNLMIGMAEGSDAGSTGGSAAPPADPCAAFYEMVETAQWQLTKALITAAGVCP